MKKEKKWKQFGQHHVDDLEKIKRAAINHNINIKLRTTGTLFIESDLLKRRPQNLKLFALTLEAFIHCREFARINEELSAFPDEAIGRCKAYMDNYYKSPVSAPEYFAKTNDEVFKASKKELINSGAITNDTLHNLAGYAQSTTPEPYYRD